MLGAVAFVTRYDCEDIQVSAAEFYMFLENASVVAGNITGCKTRAEDGLPPTPPGLSEGAGPVLLNHRQAVVIGSGVVIEIPVIIVDSKEVPQFFAGIGKSLQTRPTACFRTRREDVRMQII